MHRARFLLEENQNDLDLAKKSGIAGAVLDRIALNPSRVQAMAKGLRDVAALPDPVREVVKMWRRPNGLQVGRMRIPLGVIGIIYEARPKRDGGCCRAVPQIRQRGHSPRR
jgi:glutamate-5-semialdehyde dehydrogenase